MEEVLINNGLPGVIILALGYVVFYLYKKQDARQVKLEEDLQQLRKRFDEYIDQDRRTMFQLIQESTRAMVELKEIIHEHHKE